MAALLEEIEERLTNLGSCPAHEGIILAKRGEPAHWLRESGAALALFDGLSLGCGAGLQFSGAGVPARDWLATMLHEWRVSRPSRALDECDPRAQIRAERVRPSAMAGGDARPTEDSRWGGVTGTPPALPIKCGKRHAVWDADQDGGDFAAGAGRVVTTAPGCEGTATVTLDADTPGGRTTPIEYP